MKDLSDEQYKKFAYFVEKQCGISLGENKEYLVVSRLTPLISEFGVLNLTELIKQVIVGNNLRLRNAVIDAMTTNETLWFRDIYPFQLLVEKLFSEISKHKNTIKIWSAASSSGQEVYSIAISALEYKKATASNSLNIKVVGSDISDSMLTQCRKAHYDKFALSRGLSDTRKRQFFVPVAGDENKMQLIPEVKNLTSFQNLNLLGDYTSIGKVDMIFCRNVLIYFSHELKSKVLNKLAGSLNPGGYLIIGASESLNALTDKFEMIRCNPGIIYKLK